MSVSPVGFARRGFLAAAGVLVSGLVASQMLAMLTRSNRLSLTLVSYAVARAAYDKIIPKFVEHWKAETGQEVTIEASYGGSGTQARAVLDGLDADIVALSLALDIQRLEKAGLIAPGWENRAPHNGIVTRSVAVLVTREGNPKGIQDWQDLVRDGIEVVTPNPKTSGGARWNFLSLWGHKTLVEGVSEEAALEFTTRVYQNVGVLPRDAREATDVFFQKGQGDVLITYEHEVLLANLRGGSLPYVLPSSSISIDNPVAVVDKIVDRKGTREVAEAFVAFLFTPAAQREFAAVGFRPVNPEVAAEFANQYPRIENLFTVEDLGGWDAVQAKFFEAGTVFDDIQAQL
ncbi:MAG: sulfate ABC transporter substrate-binding protein [Cyanobacteriota bacterium]